jgi:hypothetical protein
MLSYKILTMSLNRFSGHSLGLHDLVIVQ